MQIRKIDDDFSVSGQLLTTDMAAIKAAGFKGVVCARPDQEEPGQPSFAEIEAAAKAEGLMAVHVPVAGLLSEGQIIRFGEAMDAMGRPVLGYCRSGARAGSLYATLEA